MSLGARKASGLFGVFGQNSAGGLSWWVWKARRKSVWARAVPMTFGVSSSY
jgi:hypothetical protein